MSTKLIKEIETLNATAKIISYPTDSGKQYGYTIQSPDIDDSNYGFSSQKDAEKAAKNDLESLK